MTDDIQITSGRELRREYEEGVPVRLPFSGATVRVRSVEPDALLLIEDIPEILTPVIAKLMEEGSWRQSDDDEKSNAEKLKELTQWRHLVNAIAAAALVSPRVVDKPADQLADDEIRIEHLKWFDKVHLVGVLNRPLDDLNGFREQQEGDVADLGVTGDDGAASEPAPEPEPVGEAEVSA